jgi:hypothetical protein
MIQHTVAFRLHGTADDRAFWVRVEGLAKIGGVRRFQVLRQVGTKNEFTHALSMYFDSSGDYDGYNEHPDHVAFVEEAWIPNVADFIELDYVDHDG